MAKTVTLYSKTNGLNNYADPTRIMYDMQSGTIDLAEAYNVDVDSSGRLSMRKGFTATARTEEIGKVFCKGGECLFVSGSVLYKLNEDYTRTSLKTGLTSGLEMYYEQVGNRIYYSNYVERGYVLNGVAYDWVVGTYVGPTTYKVFHDPPPCSIICFHSGRLYLVSADVIWYSEPFAYGWFDTARSFIPLGSNIRMLCSVGSGMFVGLEDGVWFLNGTTPASFSFAKAADSPVVSGTDVVGYGVKLGEGGVSGSVAFWTAQDGIYAGFPSGEAKNLTKNRLVFPASAKGCAVLNGNKYLTLLR